jgi:hypothetical protein
MTTSLKLLSVVSTLFLFACGGDPGPSGNPDAGTSPSPTDSGHQTSDAGNSTGDGGQQPTGDGGTSDGGTTTAPARPTVTGTLPATRGSDPQPQVLGTAEPGVTVDLYDSLFCLGEALATGTAGEDGRFAIRFPADLNSSVNITAKARRGTLSSECSDKWVSYAHDDRAPEVSSVTPSRDATNVVVTIAPVANFSESPVADSVLVDVSCGGQPVQGNVGVSGSRVTFTPAANLPEVTVCTVTVRGAKDAVGNVLAAPYTWSFTTQRIPDPNPPTFTGTTPTSPGTSTTPSVLGRAGAGLTVELFSTSDCAGSAVSSGTVNSSGTFSLPVTVAANASTSFWGQAVDLAKRRSVCSPTSQAYVHDSLAPTVTATSPLADAVDVDASATVSATLSEAVRSTSGLLGVRCNGLAVQGSASVSGAVVTFKPSAALPLDATCTATVVATAADLAGNQLGTAHAWNFATKPSPPPATPTLTAFNPASPGRTTTPTVQGTAASGVAVDVFYTSDCSGTPLASGTASSVGAFSIQVPVTSNASTTIYAQARSAVGRRSGCTAPGLTYVHDNVAPTVTERSPAADAVDVETSATVSATLSEAVKNTSGVLSLKCDNVTVQGSVSATATVVTFTPAQALPLDAACTAQLSTVLTDLAGNPLAAVVSWSFKTKQAPPPAAPTLSATNPASPGTTKTPTVTGKAAAGNFVELYASSDCSGTALASGTADAQGNFSITATVGANTTTLLSATARTKQGGARSACSVQTLSYRHDDTAPTVATVTPANGATDVALNAVISAEFNELVTAQSGAIVLKCADITLPGTLTVADRKLTFSPSVQPGLEANCVVTVKAGVKDQAGNSLASDYSWSYVTRSAQWSMSEVVATSPGTVTNVEAGIDSDGDATLIWRNGQSSPYPISRHDVNPTQGASTGVVLNTTNSNQPVVAVSPNGHAIIAWRDYSANPNRIVATVFVPGTGWTTPQAVSSTTVDLSASDPRVAINNSGHALVVFVQHPHGSTFAYSLYARLFTPAGGWGQQVEIDGKSEDFLDAKDPFVTPDGKGGFFVVWSGEHNAGTGYNFHLFFTWLRASTTTPGSFFWESAKLFPSELYPSNPRAGCDAQGSCTVVYKRSSDAKALRYEASTQAWSSMLLGPNDNDTEGVGVSVNAAGQVVAAFSHYSSTLSRYEMMARRYEPGVGWSEPAVVGPNAANGTTGFFDVAQDAQGNAIILSRQHDASSVSHLYASRYKVGTGWLTPEEVDTGIGSDSESTVGTTRSMGPRVVMNASGQALIVYWKGKDVYARWLK